MLVQEVDASIDADDHRTCADAVEGDADTGILLGGRAFAFHQPPHLGQGRALALGDLVLGIGVTPQVLGGLMLACGPGDE